LAREPQRIENRVVHQPQIKTHTKIQDSDQKTETHHSSHLTSQTTRRVEFKMIDGLAIAYGDLILGKPTEDFQGIKGTYDVPTPQYWDQTQIFYLIHPDLPQPERVIRALDYLRKNTVVNFVPYTSELAHIVKDAI
jgi:hypothetical protein